ncbi:hypothetical protein F5878DRAFT_677553, partial [Lentinula raphanica]
AKDNPPPQRLHGPRQPWTLWLREKGGWGENFCGLDGCLPSGPFVLPYFYFLTLFLSASHPQLPPSQHNDSVVYAPRDFCKSDPPGDEKDVDTETGMDKDKGEEARMKRRGMKQSISDDHRKLLDNVSGFVVPGKLTALQESQEQGRPTKCIPLEPSNSSDGTNTYRRLLQTRSSLMHLLEPTQKAVLASDSIKLASPDPESWILSTLSPSLCSPVLVRLNVLACPLIFKISLSRRCFRSLPKCKRIMIAVVRRLSGDAGRWRRRLRAIQEQGRPAKKDRGSKLKKGANVHCYDNHRVAMAFSVLASVIPDTILEEKRCVEKTWPNWWDDLQNKVC